MIIEFVVAMLFMFVATRTIIWINGEKFIPSLPFKKIKKPQIDYDYIAQQDREIFGIDTSIKEFPGYKWSVAKDDVGDIKICLLDEFGRIVKDGWVFARSYDESELESAVETRMKRLVNELTIERKKNLVLDDIVDKYNGKGVQL